MLTCQDALKGIKEQSYLTIYQAKDSVIDGMNKTKHYIN